MKKCPTCRRTFDDTLTFCLIDGSVLSAPFNPEFSESPDQAPTEFLDPEATRDAIPSDKSGPPTTKFLDLEATREAVPFATPGPPPTELSAPEATREAIPLDRPDLPSTKLILPEDVAGVDPSEPETITVALGDIVRSGETAREKSNKWLARPIIYLSLIIVAAVTGVFIWRGLPGSRETGAPLSGAGNAASPTPLQSQSPAGLGLVRTLTGHSGGVTSVAFSPDGMTIVSGGYDDTLKLWDVHTGTLKYTLAGHTETIYSVAFSPDGKTLASGSLDNTIKLWDTQTGTLQRTINSNSGVAAVVIFSPDGTSLINGNGDSSVKIWDPATGALKATIRSGHLNGVDSMALSSDGKLLAIGGNNGGKNDTISIRDVETGKLKTRLAAGRSIDTLAFSPDGRILVSGGTDNSIKIWDVDTGKLTDDGYFRGISAIAFSPDGETFVCGGGDKTIWIRYAISGLPINSYTGHSDSITSIALSPDGKTLASGSYDKTVRLWRLSE